MRILALEQASWTARLLPPRRRRSPATDALVGVPDHARRRHRRRLRLSSLGRSQQGRDLPLIYLTREGLDDPLAIARLDRPVIWLIGQQHGNEPAGGEAMLALAAALSSGELAPLLDRLSIVIVPRGNPDGAAADRRVLASGVDLNRDHLLLSQPETRALHQVMRLLPPDVVIDHHEFSVAGRWAEKFGALHAVDVMILEATHPGVPESLTEIAGRLYRPALEAAMDQHGLSSHDYVTTGTDMDDRLVSLGGNAPGIARNAFGLRGSVSYLIETRGVGIGLQSYQRRVATHYLLAKSLLEASAAEGANLRTAIAAARREAAADRSPLVVSHQLARRPLEMPLMDPQSGAARPTPVTLADSRTLTAIEHRERPHGYLVLREGKAVAERLALNEVRACVVEAACQDRGRGLRCGASRHRLPPPQRSDQSRPVDARDDPAGDDRCAGGRAVRADEPTGGGDRRRRPGARLARQLSRRRDRADGRRRERGAGLSRDDRPAVLDAALGLCWGPPSPLPLMRFQPIIVSM